MAPSGHDIRKLWDAISSNHIDKVRTLLGRLTAEDLRMVSRTCGDTCLHLAIVWGRVDICELLLRADADPKQPNRAGWVPVVPLPSDRKSLDYARQCAAAALVANWKP